ASAILALHCPSALSQWLCCPRSVERDLLHEPTMADDDRLPRQRIGVEAREKQGRFRYVLDRRELVIDGVLQHDIVDDLLLRNAQLLGLLRNLFVDERSTNEAGADHVRAYAMLGPFLGDDPSKPEQAMLRRDIGCFEL